MAREAEQPGLRLGIVGASVRAAAFSAHRSGFDPVAADRFADRDLGELCPATRVDDYPDGLLAWLQSTRPDAWMYTGGLENHPELVDAMAGVCPLWGNAGNVLRTIRSPRQLAAVLQEAGLLFPDTRASTEGLPRDGSWLVKTYRSAGGAGVQSFLGEPPHGLSPSDPVFQQRVAGTSCSAVFISRGQSADLLGVVRQLVGTEWLGAAEFQYSGAVGPHTFGPDSLRDDLMSSIERIGSVLAERFALVGLFGVDLVVDGDRVWTIEINPRYPASVEVIERVTGFRTVARQAAACRGVCYDQPPRAPTSARVHGKAILFAERSVTVSKRFSDWAMDEARAAPWPALSDVPPAGTRIDAGQPVLTTFADGNSPDEAQQRLQKRIAEVVDRLYAD